MSSESSENHSISEEQRGSTSYIGSSVPRVEDTRLVSGEGCYVADIRMPGCLEAAFVRGAVAHGRLRGVHLDAARQVPGVLGVWAAADLPGLPTAQPLFPSEALEGREWPALASGRVRYVGQSVAIVLAADRYAAEDGADAVVVEVDELPAVLDPTEAAKEGAPELFLGLNNIISETSIGEPIDDEAWENAPVVVEAAYRQQRLAPTSMEARAFLAKPEDNGGLTVWCSHQAPHRLQRDLATVLEMPAEELRVIVPDVGGAFGAKSETFPEYVGIAYLARHLDRTVRWVEDRSEALIGATHGRGQNQRVRLAAERDGQMLALEVEVDADVGAYGHYGFAPIFNMARHVTEVYKTPRVHARVRGVATNATPTAPYRGAGRPEAAYAVERTVDLLARRLGIDPAELRRRNFIPPGAFPYETPTGLTYDNGDYAAALEKALEAADYDGWRAEQAQRRESGEGAPLGLGICSYVEGAGMMEEYGAVEVGEDGTFVALSGTSSTGQSHETTFAQVVASALEVDVGRVRLIQADTRAVPRGVGSYASRSMQVGGSALYRAALKVVDEARRRMAKRCGVVVEEVGYQKGNLHAGAETLTLAELVEQSGPLRAEDMFGPPQSFPYGCYVAVVEVDPDLGNVRVLRLIAVDDCGVVINPMVVEGQTYGSIAQGIGQALYEQMPYDAEGQPLALGLLDYLLPTLSEIPPLQLEEMHTPNPNTPLGAKGVGESGCIGSPPAIVNAVADALDLDDPGVLQMPLTPEVCWTASRSRA